MKNWLGIVSAFLFFAIGLSEIQTFAQDAAPSKKIAVAYRAAIFRDSGASDTCALASLQILNNTAGFEAKYVSAQEIRDGILKDFDVVLFPGGSGSGESKSLGDEGWVELRKFLNDGGGYIGTCAGAYMALVNLSRDAGRLIDAELQEGEWERGEAILDIELTDDARYPQFAIQPNDISRIKEQIRLWKPINVVFRDILLRYVGEIDAVASITGPFVGIGEFGTAIGASDTESDTMVVPDYLDESLSNCAF